MPQAGNCWQFAMRIYCKDPFDFVPFQEEPFPPPNWTTQRFAGEWKGSTAGGCVKYPTFKNNPQFGLQIPGDKCKVVIILKQKDTAFPIQVSLRQRAPMGSLDGDLQPPLATPFPRWLPVKHHPIV